MPNADAIVPRLLGDHAHDEPVRLQDVEQWISSTDGVEVTDEVVALPVVAASEHERAGRRALARSLQLYARELLRPYDLGSRATDPGERRRPTPIADETH